MRELLFPAAPTTRASVGLLLLRAVAGGAMMTHGWSKIQNPFHWMDKAADPPAAIFQALAAVSEFFGGFALVVGLLTVIASFGIASTMVVAINVHLGKGDPFGKYELAVLYLVIAGALMLTGPGLFSGDRFLRAKLQK